MVACPPRSSSRSSMARSVRLTPCRIIHRIAVGIKFRVGHDPGRSTNGLASGTEAIG